MKKLATLKILAALIITFLCFSASVLTLKANNLIVSEATLTDQNTTEHFVMVSFNLSWQNSWRNDINYDGVWLFVKFQRTGSGEWCTAKLSSTANEHNTGTQQQNATISPTFDGKGIFYYRSAEGTGGFESNDIQLRWNYGENYIQDGLPLDIQKLSVFGIEMCYVPQGSFYLGSGGSEANHFFTYPNTSTPYQVTSENEITVGTSDGNLQYTGDNQYGGDHTGLIPAAFPKGYNAFWCMKYEITQEQYVDFLNTLERIQQCQRVAADISSTNVSNRYVMSNTNGVSYRNGIRCDGTIPAAPLPVTFYCDLNFNGVMNEEGDGQNIACNFLSWDDGVAYSVWAGLRPMTELEFEKACRGTTAAVPNEYAWGNTDIIQASGLMNSGFGYEAVTTGNCNYWTSSNPIMGPLRSGIFASANSTRTGSGSSYYGIMELSANLSERCITVGNAGGRAYNPTLNEQPSNSVWGLRGMLWYGSIETSRVSNRGLASDIYFNRVNDIGFRCVSGGN